MWAVIGNVILRNQWGELLVEGVFDDFGEFSEGLALVRVGDTFGYIDTLGTMVIQLPEDASYCGDFITGALLSKEEMGIGTISTGREKSSIAVQRMFF